MAQFGHAPVAILLDFIQPHSLEDRLEVGGLVAHQVVEYGAVPARAPYCRNRDQVVSLRSGQRVVKRIFAVYVPEEERLRHRVAHLAAAIGRYRLCVSVVLRLPVECAHVEAVELGQLRREVCVLAVVLAVGTLDLGGSGAGYLTATHGAGAALGAIAVAKSAMLANGGSGVASSVPIRRRNVPGPLPN